MSIVAENQADIAFLLERSFSAGTASMRAGRATGASSNDLVRLAFTGESQRILPCDRSDAGACVRTWRKLPAHRRTAAVRAQLRDGIRYVKAKETRG